METYAKLRNVRLSAQRGRLVADMVRGKPVARALSILAFAPQKSAKVLKKIIESAVANAEHNQGADVDQLFVRTVLVDKAATLRRFRARAKGRGNVIRKQTCNIQVVVAD